MEAINRLLERLGFVRLRDYGLILTPDRRVVTLRSTVLDDGQCVVGWREDDLVTMGFATRDTAQPPNQLAQPIAVVPAPVPAAPDEQDDESDWDDIIARARAAAADTPPPRIVSSPPSIASTRKPPPPPRRVPRATNRPMSAARTNDHKPSPVMMTARAASTSR